MRWTIFKDYRKDDGGDLSEMEHITSRLRDCDLDGVLVTVGENSGANKGKDNRGIDLKKLQMGNPKVNTSYKENIERVWKLDQLGNILLKNLSKKRSGNDSPTISMVVACPLWYAENWVAVPMGFK